MSESSTKTRTSTPRYGLPEDAINKLAKEVGKVLADTHVLYIMTLCCHWNVVDPRFMFLHEFFEDQYKELAKAQDVIAERVRFMGRRPPSSLAEFLEITSLKEIRQELSADDMLQVLAEAHESMVHALRRVIQDAASHDDEGTADMLTARLRSHEKNAWMLRSHLSA